MIVLFTITVMGYFKRRAVVKFATDDYLRAELLTETCESKNTYAVTNEKFNSV